MSSEGSVMITDPTGLHARPAVKLTKLAKQFDSTVEIRASPTGAWTNAKSPNSVMKLKAKHGDVLEIRADGADAPAAVEALVALMEKNVDGA